QGVEVEALGRRWQVAAPVDGGAPAAGADVQLMLRPEALRLVGHGGGGVAPARAPHALPRGESEERPHPFGPTLLPPPPRGAGRAPARGSAVRVAFDDGALALLPR